MIRRLNSLVATALCTLCLLAPRQVAARQVDPAYRFETVRTAHFAIHFHEATAPLVPHLAAVAEETWRRMNLPPEVVAPSLTHVVLVDQSESANGFANVFPRNTIVMFTARPPVASLLNPDDWLRTLFVHEYTHIVHLDQARGWARLARRVFGRTPWSFPNLLLPTWQIEGLATWEESQDATQQHRGRLHTGDFLTLTGEAARSGSPLSMDQVNGGLTDWPGGLTPYAYGLSFHAWLARRYGASSLVTLSRETAGSLPWLGSRAFARVYGRSLGDLWSDFTEESKAAAPDTASPRTPTRRLTEHGFYVSAPRFLPSSCEGCTARIVYGLNTAHDRPSLQVLSPDTLENRRLATRFSGRTSAPGADVIYFDQVERRRNVGLYSDLFAYDRRTGRVAPVTHEARLMEPDLSPDGHTIAAVQHGRPDRRDLVIVDIEPDLGGSPAVSVLASEAGTHFSTPRWSPDGRRIVATRQLATGTAHIVVVDRQSGSVTTIGQQTRMRWATPTWHPDGNTIVAAGAAGDAPFELYDIRLDDGRIRRLTHLNGGATWPDISADGGTIVFVGYTVDGFDLFDMPYPDVAPSIPTPAGTTGPGPAQPPSPAQMTTPRLYRPWESLTPTSWTPVVTTSSNQIRAGLLVAGTDVLGYHSWQAAIDRPVLESSDVADGGSRTDWQASYVYTRWQPQVWTTAASRTTLFSVQTDSADIDIPSALVERTAEIGVRLPIRRLRHSQAAQVSFVRAVDTLTRSDGARQRNRSGIRAAWTFSSAQRPGYSISPERGVTMGIASEFVRPGLGASGRTGTATGDIRVYLPGPSRHHVFAVRAAGGTTWGDESVRRIFVLGGGRAGPGPANLSSDSASLLRGFPVDSFAGRHVATINLDYRVPLARPQRGLGTWPVFLHSVHAAVVADVGHTWNSRFRRGDVKRSIGLELSANLVLGYALPLTVSGGLAYGHDGHTQAAGATAYGRLGYAF